MWIFPKNSFMKNRMSGYSSKDTEILKSDKAQNKNLLLFIEAANICLREESFEKLSVSRIVSKAGLSRQTFYRCCSSKFDMVNRYYDRILKTTFKEAAVHRNLHVFLLLLMERMIPKKDLFRAAFVTEDYDGLTKYAQRQVYQAYLDYLKRKYDERIDSYYERLLELYSISFVQIIKQWSFGDILKDVGEAVDMVRDVTPAKLEILL